MVAVENGSYSDQLRLGTEVYHSLREVLIKKYGKAAVNVGMEGGFTPPAHETEEALDLIVSAAKNTGASIKIILDMASSTFFKNGKYYFEGEECDQKFLADYYAKLVKKYPIIGLEDPFSQDDWPALKTITDELGKKVNIIGDDVLVTNVLRIEQAKKQGACNAMILKPNQVGTISETIAAAKLAKENGWEVFVKHRSGETCDTFLADLAVGLGSGFLMAGAPNRGERVAKYNRVLRIEQEMKNL
jgi:enolase